MYASLKILAPIFFKGCEQGFEGKNCQYKSQGKPCWSGNVSTVILSLLLIQDGQLSVSGKRMGISTG